MISYCFQPCLSLLQSKPHPAFKTVSNCPWLLNMLNRKEDPRSKWDREILSLMGWFQRCQPYTSMVWLWITLRKNTIFQKVSNPRGNAAKMLYTLFTMNLTYFHQHFNVITSKYLFFKASAVFGMSPAYLFEKTWSEDWCRHLLNI